MISHEIDYQWVLDRYRENNPVGSNPKLEITLENKARFKRARERRLAELLRRKGLDGVRNSRTEKEKAIQEETEGDV